MTEQPVEYMLTTVDNPFSPFTQFKEWMAYDAQLGYNTPSFLDRIANVSHDQSPADQASSLQDAIDEIIRENVSGMWKKVQRSDYPAIAA